MSRVKLIIAGSRDFTDYSEVEQAVADFIEASGHIITEIVSGRARGVDKLGELYATRHGLPIEPFPAKWGEHGRKAGPIRNAQMAEYADALVAVWNGTSNGTRNMIEQMTRLGKYVWIHKINMP